MFENSLNDWTYLLIEIVYFVIHAKEIFAIFICRKSLQSLFHGVTAPPYFSDVFFKISRRQANKNKPDS